MMEIEYKRNHVGAGLGLRYRLVNQELLLQNEYLAAEYRIFESTFASEFATVGGRAVQLAEIGQRLGRKGCGKWRALPNPIPFSAGIANWSRKVRWLEAPPLARPTARQCRERESGGSLRTRKLWLGLRSDCGSVGEPACAEHWGTQSPTRP
jgi:hypothetical protein